MTLTQKEASYLTYFKQLCEIPHGSGNEKKLSDFLVQFAKNLNLDVYQDELYNVLIKKPASLSHATQPVALQGHMDMVCEKNMTTVHDFETDPLTLSVEGNMLRANGTTLGADNGTAVSYMMALLASDDLVHPPLECVFTTQEETGLFGAYAFDTSRLHAKRMINLDAGPEGYALIGSAGGARGKFKLPVSWQRSSGTAYAMRVSGLLGGHSGGDIDKEKGNAIILAGRLLSDISNKTQLNLVSVNGGAKDNAIPRECDVVFNVPTENTANVEACVAELRTALLKEYQTTDSNLFISLVQCDDAVNMMTDDCTQRVMSFLTLAPNGVFKMSPNLENLVVSSSNLGVVSSTEDYVTFTAAMRSSESSLLTHTVTKFESLCNLLKISSQFDSFYPAWEYVKESPLRAVCQQVYEQLRQTPLQLRAVHGGLECGVFIDKCENLDVVAFGPSAYNVHTPDEALDLDSFDRTYEYLVEVLKTLGSV